jgi:hypothetical protein
MYFFPQCLYSVSVAPERPFRCYSNRNQLMHVRGANTQRMWSLSLTTQFIGNIPRLLLSFCTQNQTNGRSSDAYTCLNSASKHTLAGRRSARSGLRNELNNILGAGEYLTLPTLIFRRLIGQVNQPPCGCARVDSQTCRSGECPAVWDYKR